jgi:hypothetical protein
MIRLLAMALAAGALVVALGESAGAERATIPPNGYVASPQPNYIPFYTSVPSPIPSAYAAIGAAFGAANVYNTNLPSGIGILNTQKCNFLCYGAPGVASSGVVVMGNDVSSGNSFTTLGAPDDCNAPGSGPCPAGIADNVFAIESWRSPAGPPAVLVAINQLAQLGVSNGIYAAGPIVAGAGTPTPFPSPGETPSPMYPSPRPGSLVSFTGIGRGELLLGSASDFVKCDYGESATSMLTCNKPVAVMVGGNGAGIGADGTVWASGGVRPHSTAGGGSGGYAPEAFPDGAPTQHPQIVTGSCSVNAPSSSCTFPNGFTFADGSYECTVSAQGSYAVSSSFEKSSNATIVVHTNESATFSYTCME